MALSRLVTFHVVAFTDGEAVHLWKGQVWWRSSPALVLFWIPKNRSQNPAILSWTFSKRTRQDSRLHIGALRPHHRKWRDKKPVMERQSAGVVRTDATDIIILLQMENRICRSNSQNSARVLSSQFYPALKFGASTNWSDFVLLYSHKMASLATRNSSFFWLFLSARPLAFYDVNYTMRLAWPAKREWYGNSKQILWNFQDASVGSSQNRTFKRPKISPFRILSFWKILSLVDFPVDWTAGFSSFQVGGLWKPPGEDGRNGTLDALLLSKLLGPMNLFSLWPFWGVGIFERLNGWVPVRSQTWQIDRDMWHPGCLLKHGSAAASLDGISCWKTPKKTMHSSTLRYITMEHQD